MPSPAVLDGLDELAHFRDRFVIEDDTIYLDGNSLGRLPKETGPRIHQLVYEQWGATLVRGWEQWLDEGLRIGDALAPLIGANLGEVAICDQTSINLFKLASAGLAAGGRDSIVTDRANFPSDRYILESVASSHGGRVIFAEDDPTPESISELVDDTVGLVSLSHVAYRSGAMADGAAITEVVHEQGALMLWDLAHSAGAVPVALSQWRADLAVGCTYKYLNAGPGAPGFLYVRSDIQTELSQPIRGWFGHADQFGFAPDWRPADGIRRFLVGTPPMISMVGVDVGIALTTEAGIESIRGKSLALSSAFLDATAHLGDHGITTITPTEPARRGSHVTLVHDRGFQIAANLRDRGVIPDFRAPDLIRFGFAPLYTTFQEVATAADVLTDIVESQSYLAFGENRSGVT